MPFVPFHNYFPKMADRETRSIAVPPGSNLGLPPGEYGFLEFYCDKSMAAQMKGPALNPGSPATEVAPALVELVRNALLKDPAHVERIKRHYQMVREKIDRPKRHRRGRLKKRR